MTITQPIKTGRVAENSEPIDLIARLTRRYVTGWSHLDKWHRIGECRTFASSPAKWDDRGESYRSVQFVQVAAHGYRSANIKRALMSVFDHGCRCEHDCCGHVQTAATRTRHLGGNVYAVMIRGYRNI
jgi:hypothetical protein